jgi:acyl carrier protein
MQIDTTDKNALFNEIARVLQEDFECDPEMLKPEANLFEELDLDSIDAVDLVVTLQKTTGIKVKPEDFKQIRTLQDITDVVYGLLNKE